MRLLKVHVEVLSVASNEQGTCNADKTSYSWDHYSSCDCGAGGFSVMINGKMRDGTKPVRKTLYTTKCVVDTAEGAIGICGKIETYTACTTSEMHADSARVQKDHRKPAKKIGFMFTCISDVMHVGTWERFFHGYDGLFNVYFSCRDRDKVTQAFVRRHLVPEYVQSTRRSMLKSNKNMYSHSVRNGDHKIVLLSTNSLPLKSFNYIYDFLTRDEFENTSYIAYQPKVPRNRHEVATLHQSYRRFVNCAAGSPLFAATIDIAHWYFHDFWTILTAAHAKLLVEDPQRIEHAMERCWANDENYAMYVLSTHNELHNVRALATMHNNWTEAYDNPEGGRSPKWYSLISEKDLDEFSQPSILFGRKFRQDSDIVQHIESLWRAGDQAILDAIEGAGARVAPFVRRTCANQSDQELPRPTAIKQSCGVVGASGILKLHPQGVRIDAHDFVIRHRANPFGSAFSEMAGSRVDLSLLQRPNHTRGFRTAWGKSLAEAYRNMEWSLGALDDAGAEFIVSEDAIRQIDAIQFRFQAFLNGPPSTEFLAVLVALNMCAESHVYGYHLSPIYQDSAARHVEVPHTYWAAGPMTQRPRGHSAHRAAHTVAGQPSGSQQDRAIDLHDYDTEKYLLQQLKQSGLIHIHL